MKNSRWTLISKTFADFVHNVLQIDQTFMLCRKQVKIYVKGNLYAKLEFEPSSVAIYLQGTERPNAFQ